MIAGRPSRPRPRHRFSSSPAALEPRALLSGAAEVAPAVEGPTVTVRPVYYEADGLYPVKGGNQDFSGDAGAPGARIDVFATPRRGESVLLGRVVAVDDGSWRLASTVPLADGLYAVTARATDPATGLVGAPATMASKLLVDNVGPRIVGVRLFPRQGRIVVSFRDFGGPPSGGAGVYSPDLDFPGSYDFGPLKARSASAPADSRWWTTAADLLPARRDGVQRVAVTINDGARIPAGRYRLYVRSPSVDYPPATYPYGMWFPYWFRGISDRVGNKLDGAATSRIPAPEPGDFATAFAVRGCVALQFRGRRPV